jgi:hypothetical protein
MLVILIDFKNVCSAWSEESDGSITYYTQKG